ncbi:MAG TPA: hypothetical protein VI916_03885, partial [Acidimicrobiia bacterium]|nr:hypothetical protein [Acidimicrobiia bacterium]
TRTTAGGPTDFKGEPTINDLLDDKDYQHLSVDVETGKLYVEVPVDPADPKAGTQSVEFDPDEWVETDKGWLNVADGTVWDAPGGKPIDDLTPDEVPPNEETLEPGAGVDPALAVDAVDPVEENAEGSDEPPPPESASEQMTSEESSSAGEDAPPEFGTGAATETPPAGEDGEPDATAEPSGTAEATPETEPPVSESETAAPEPPPLEPEPEPTPESEPEPEPELETTTEPEPDPEPEPLPG